ncbi:large conductance mechanosensitive channel [Verrucomicrobium sp. GAS474]|uniref:large conductance mechanosensitive channel protein MscL n=1 Tax=Verrucomicrobium sp. GAS474 TaxID=1882831 RepID=UPI00087C7E48|nr:large conductance mechanosensitive channel protein MscL [Verrucomicrobium sp. GAS474]SDT88334.1 large conductance mechanosensitive channel [Verrucomicrobium sp. GAS474]
MSFFKDFREFAVKGNMVDLAVGVIIGGAFGNVVNSIVTDLVMPIVGRLTPGSTDFSKHFWALSDKAQPGDTIAKLKADSIPVFAYGNFLTVTLNFLIVALCVFLLVKFINIARRAFEAEMLVLANQKAEEPSTPAPTEAPAPAPDIVLLTEIRDLLKQQAKG